MPEKISVAELQRMVADPSIPESALRPYFTARSSLGRPFEPLVVPDPEMVEIDPTAREFESALTFGNDWSRMRRKFQFDARILLGDPRPILVSEGDSWFQFPILLDDVIDHLSERYTICSLGAAGDRAGIMLSGDPPEYLAALRALNGRAEAFLFSGAGNDVIGADDDGNPVIERLLLTRQGAESAVELLDDAALDAVLAQLRAHYTGMIAAIRGEPGLASLPVLIHGYAHAFPGAPDDARDPVWAEPDQWLGSAMRRKNIDDPDLQHGIVTLLIDRLYGMLQQVAAPDPQVHLVDVRPLMLARSDWADEIHPHSAAFGRVAAVFAEAIEAARAIG